MCLFGFLQGVFMKVDRKVTPIMRVIGTIAGKYLRWRHPVDSLREVIHNRVCANSRDAYKASGWYSDIARTQNPPIDDIDRIWFMAKSLRFALRALWLDKVSYFYERSLEN